MELPNAANAFIDMRKLVEYCLSTFHPVGRHKAEVFQSALGLTTDDAELLKGWLLQAALSDEAVAGPADEYGVRFQIDFEASTAVGQAKLRSAWIVRTGEDFPRLVSCYILPR
jgi:hypothetical protein